MKSQGPVLIAIAVGLGLGLGLAAPMAALLRGDATEETEARQSIANPFAGWVEGSGEDLLVLGTDEGGGNTDVITLVRIEGESPASARFPAIPTLRPSAGVRSRSMRFTASVAKRR